MQVCFGEWQFDMSFMGGQFRCLCVYLGERNRGAHANGKHS